MNKIFFGVDESEDMDKEGIVSIVYFGILGERENELMSHKIESILNKREIKEIKHSNSNNILVDSVLRLSKKIITYKFVYIRNKSEQKSISDHHYTALNLFVDNINKRFINVVSKVDIKIDKFAGNKFEKKYKSILETKLKIKKSIKFVDSGKYAIIQMTDIYAGEYRLDFHKKRKGNESIKQNKIPL